MYDYCGDCEYLGRKENETYKDFWSGETKYKCKRTGDYKKINDSSCNDIRKIERKNEGYQPSGCYITTIVCDILGLSDNCEILNVLRNFRNNYLRGNKEYEYLLKEYDVIGPIISSRIANNPNELEKMHNAQNLLKGFIVPCARFINVEDYESAIITYTAMVNYLKNIYDINTPNLDNLDNYDYSLSGTGRALKKDTSIS